MNWDMVGAIVAISGQLILLGGLYLGYQRLNVDKPLTAAQAGAAKMEGLSSEFDIMERLTTRQSLLAEKQNNTIEALRGDVMRATNLGEEKIAALRVETEARIVKQDLAAKTENQRLQDQLTAQSNAAMEQSAKQEGLLRAALEELVSVKSELRDTRSELKDARSEIADLNVLLTKANRETADAKQETVKAEAETKAAA
jgi:hypothetical protein